MGLLEVDGWLSIQKIRGFIGTKSFAIEKSNVVNLVNLVNLVNPVNINKTSGKLKVKIGKPNIH